ncbi:MAG: MinD/ParA family protein [Thermodesulfobacteriota bacterium]
MANEQRPQRAKKICISSGKGGVGKTSFAVNLATSLAARQKKVLLIDGDLGLANVDVLLGLNVRHTVRENIEEGRDLAGLLLPVAAGFHLLPATSGVPEMASLSYEEQHELIRALDAIMDQFDFVLVDTAAGIGDSVLWFNAWADLNVVIVSPDPTSMADAYALIKVMVARHRKNAFQLVTNSITSPQEGREIFEGLSGVAAKYLRITASHLGALPHDPAVVRAIRSRKPFLLDAPESKVSLAVMQIADKILEL